MHDQHLFQLGEKLLLVTIERQTILIDGAIAGFVELLSDQEQARIEARIWLYPGYRPLAEPVRRWIVASHTAADVIDLTPGAAEIVGPAGPRQAEGQLAEPDRQWRVGFRSERHCGYEVFIKDRRTGFHYPLYSSRDRRSAEVKRQEVERDLLILNAEAFAAKWGLQRLGSISGG